jgi:hypothetical protein
MHSLHLIPRLIVKDAEKRREQSRAADRSCYGAPCSGLTAEWEVVEADPGGSGALQPAGTVLWSRSWGWRILPTLLALNYYSGHINVERTGTNSRGVGEAIDALLAAASTVNRQRIGTPYRHPKGTPFGGESGR